MSGSIYFVQGPDDGLIKIGHTSDVPDCRYFGLIASCPVPLAKLGVMPGDRDDEQALHREFMHLRRYNEWFTPGPDLLAFIAEHAGPWPDSGLVAPSSTPEQWRSRRLDGIPRPIRFMSKQAEATRYAPGSLRLNCYNGSGRPPFIHDVASLREAKSIIHAIGEYQLFLESAGRALPMAGDATRLEMLRPDGVWDDWTSADGYILDDLPDDLIDAIDEAVRSMAEPVAPAPGGRSEVLP